jgi:hypothetical protein
MKSALDSLIDELKAGTWQAQSPRPAQVEEAGWPPASLDAERRFGQPHAKLFPFIGRKVRTPSGPGTLLQVFAERVTVLLDSELSKCAWFPPGEIEPASWELP